MGRVGAPLSTSPCDCKMLCKTDSGVGELLITDIAAGCAAWGIEGCGASVRAAMWGFAGTDATGAADMLFDCIAAAAATIATGAAGATGAGTGTTGFAVSETCMPSGETTLA